MRMLVTGRGWVGGPTPCLPRSVGCTAPCGVTGPRRSTVCRDLAERWGAAQVAVKVEGDRSGTPSFKVVGTTWAVTEALREHVPARLVGCHGLEALRAGSPDLTLAAASEGNHGEALAFVARLVGLRCRVYVSEEVADGFLTPSPRAGCRGGVRARHLPTTPLPRPCARRPVISSVVVSDTSWPSYERVPRAVATGYSTILREAADQLARTDFSAVDLVVVPIGVGALASAVIDHAATGPGPAPRVVGIEPAAAACVMASLAGRRDPHPARAAGFPAVRLNFGTPSLVVGPPARRTGSGRRAGRRRGPTALRVLPEAGLAVGPCAGAVVAAAELLLSGPGATDTRSMLDLPESPSVLLLATDGPRLSEPGPIQQTEDRRVPEHHPAGSLAPPGLAEDLPGRHARLRHEMAEQGLAWLLAVRDETVTYLSGYVSTTFRMHSRPVVALLSHDALHVVAAETEVDSVQLRVPEAIVSSYVEMDPPSPGLPDGHLQFAPHAGRVLADLVEGHDGALGVDGLEAAWPPVGQLARLMPGLRRDVVDASSLVWRCRMRKSTWEVGRMRHWREILRQVFDLMPERIRPGMTEREISRAFSITQLELGAHEVGPHGAVARMQHGLFGDRADAVWHPDELLYLDGAPIVDGYWANTAARTRHARQPLRAGRACPRPRRARSGAAGDRSRGERGLGRRRDAGRRSAPSRTRWASAGSGTASGFTCRSRHPCTPTRTRCSSPHSTLCIEPTVPARRTEPCRGGDLRVTSEGLQPISPPAPPGSIEL